MYSICYECEICLSVNHSARLHCQHCGTIPAKYSVIRKPTRIIETEYFASFVQVVKAHGYDRTEWHRTSRTYLRTVPADYYASE